MNDNAGAAVRVACDVGGTFTDVCVLDEATGKIHVAKSPTTPDPIDGVLAGISAAGVDLKDVVLFSHGTTLSTNALITRNFPPAIMVTTKGFRDIVDIGYESRFDQYDLQIQKKAPLTPRSLRFGVAQRHSARDAHDRREHGPARRGRRGARALPRRPDGRVRGRGDARHRAHRVPRGR